MVWGNRLPRHVELVDTPVDVGECVAQLVEWADPSKNDAKAGSRPYVCDGWEHGYVVYRKTGFVKFLGLGQRGVESVIQYAGPRQLRVITRVRSFLAIQTVVGVCVGLVCALAQIGPRASAFIPIPVAAGLFIWTQLFANVTREAEALRRALSGQPSSGAARGLGDGPRGDRS